MFVYFEPAQRTEADARRVMDWRNDPVTRSMFYHGELKTWPLFFQEYCERYFSDDTFPPQFIFHCGEPVGFLRFNSYSGSMFSEMTYDIDINLSPQARGKGLGSKSIRLATEILFEKGVRHVVAEVKKSNVASLRAFQNAGFLLWDEMEKEIPGGEKMQRVPIFRLVTSSHRRSVYSDGKQSSPPKTMIIAEAGSNWRMGHAQRDLEMAKQLIEVAKEAGADICKFQTYKPETVYVENAGNSDYLSKAGIQRPIVEIFRDLAMPYEMIPELKAYCDQVQIEFMSTPFSREDALAIDPFVQRHKIASYEISHLELLAVIAKTGKPVILSTGAATLDDIAWALDWLYKNGARDISLMQCTAAYPAPLSSLHLNAMKTLCCIFEIPVGLSDHSRDPVVGPVAAVTNGASVIEKHFTLHNRLPGPDHAFALTAKELGQMVRSIRSAEDVLGNHRKEPCREESELRQFACRRLQAIKDVAVGDTLILGENFEILRPGKQSSGLHPRYLNLISGRKATTPISKGSGIRSGMFA